MAAGNEKTTTTRLWSTTAAAIAAVTVVASSQNAVKVYQHGGLTHDYSGGLLATAIPEPLPQWAALPDLSSKPFVSRIGSTQTGSLRIFYRTISSTGSAIAHHKANLAWKGLHWSAFPYRTNAPALAIGLVPETGEQVAVVIHDRGGVREVEIIHKPPQDHEIAALTR